MANSTCTYGFKHCGNACIEDSRTCCITPLFGSFLPGYQNFSCGVGHHCEDKRTGEPRCCPNGTFACGNGLDRASFRLPNNNPAVDYGYSSSDVCCRHGQFCVQHDRWERGTLDYCKDIPPPASAVPDQVHDPKLARLALIVTTGMLGGITQTRFTAY